MAIFRNELRIAIRASFGMRSATTLTPYAAGMASTSPDDIAAGALGSAKQAASESPLSASRSIISFRQKIQEAASFVRHTVAAKDSLEDLNSAVAEIEKGLGELETEAARNVPSAASILEVNSKTKQRSTIRIRTQEGDIVKFDLRRMEKFSATDRAVEGDGFSASSTEVQFSSKSRMVLRVEGDLNDAEFAAIQNVFAQAEAIANEFFDGDLAAAFDLAAGLDYDTEQLSRVKMRFQEKQVTKVSYAETRTNVMPAVAIPSGDEVTPAPVAAAAAVESQPDSVVAQPDAPVVLKQPELPTVIDDSAVEQFSSFLSNILRSIGDGFESSSGLGRISAKYHFSQSFKMELLKSVIHVTAPDKSDDVVDNVIALIDSVAQTEESASDSD